MHGAPLYMVQIGPQIVVKDHDAPRALTETNTLDLGFNKSLDSRLPKIRSFDLDAFEQQILDAFDEYPQEKLDSLCDMKQRVIECIIACDPPGGNTFKLPHRSASDKD